MNVDDIHLVSTEQRPLFDCRFQEKCEGKRKQLTCPYKRRSWTHQPSPLKHISYAVLYAGVHVTSLSLPSNVGHVKPWQNEKASSMFPETRLFCGGGRWHVYLLLWRCMCVCVPVHMCASSLCECVFLYFSSLGETLFDCNTFTVGPVLQVRSFWQLLTSLRARLGLRLSCVDKTRAGIKFGLGLKVN